MEFPSKHDKVTAAAQGHAGQYLSFTLDGEEYGVDILKVQEIRGWTTTRELPETPDYVKGVLDLRGQIVPIIDLRERFQMGHPDYTPTTVIIVLCVNVAGEQHLLGAVVDAVSDVLDVDPRELRSPPRLAVRIKTRYMKGMVSRAERMVILLDVDELFDPEEFHAIERAI
jgi:purine-binding chemotaxis protein CheW